MTAEQVDDFPRFSEDYRHATPFAELIAAAPKDTRVWKRNAERIEREKAKENARQQELQRSKPEKGSTLARRPEEERRRQEARMWIWDLLTDSTNWYWRMYAEDPQRVTTEAA
ncbi:hypothetical protein WSS_A37769 [Rhodococcus opacus M213]|uniref:Uncharacterized protein n=1 Tax=Rhodococcus opacus M213 TaxID=1129896 RepID=K8X9A4_RHOOP|nr:hypothetical protein [Rhodococcus opacus]EKT77406.1 hypothetical protein WSS_A37769 [Rhodococcus opacus M213]